MIARERLEQIFRDLQISYSRQTADAVNICCPYCNDENYHCGIFTDKLNFTCWKCKSGGSLFQLLNLLIGIDWNEYQNLFEGLTNFSDKPVSEQIKELISHPIEMTETRNNVVWPPRFSVPIAKLPNDVVIQRFLKEKRLSLEFCSYNDVYVGVADRYLRYFIVPVYSRNHVVAFQGRDMIGTRPAKYLSYGNMSDFLFGYDDLKANEPVMLVEGIFDCWHAPNAVATFGTSLSSAQLRMLVEFQPIEIIVAWDIGEDGSDAYWKGRKLADELQPLFPKVSYITLPRGKDPGNLGIIKMRKLASLRRFV